MRFPTASHFRPFSISVSIILSLTTGLGTALAATEPLPLSDLQRFTGVVEQIRKYYVKPVNDQELFENAIRGMLSGLDPHSSYLDASEFSDLKASTSGKFGGLGIEVTLEEGFVRVISPIDDTPAQRAGMKAGDMIVKLNDTPVKGMTLKKAVDLMRGDKGTKITLTVLRKNTPTPLKFKLTREVIQVKSIRPKLLDKNYGYIRISQFQSQSADDMIAAIENLKKESKNNLKGLILDLRNNPGGILEASVKISDAFLDKAQLGYKGLIVYTEGRLPGSEIKEVAHDGDMLQGAPIIVLINGGSASASEIVAGALQDHKRALVVGTQSFGKGSVQTVLPLKDNYGLKLTTALYFTPSGRSIQAKGITPDIEIPDIKIPENKQHDEDNDFSVRESDLTGHLESKGAKDRVIEPVTTGDEANLSLAKEVKKDQKPLLNEDYQLNEALNLLKGLALLGPNKAKMIVTSPDKSALPIQADTQTQTIEN